MMINRRRILLLTATASIGGCLSRNENNEESTLAWVVVSNHHDDSHSVDLKIEWEGDTVLEETYDLPAHDSDSDSVPSELVDWTWPDEPGRFTVSARQSGGEWSSVDPSDNDYPDCYVVYVIVDELTGTVQLAPFTDEQFCSEEEVEKLKEEAKNETISNSISVE